MNVKAKLSLLSSICWLVACKPESQLDLTSFNMNSNSQSFSGYVVTEQNNLLAIPDDFIQIHKLSERLLNQHSLQNPYFLSEITELISLFKNTKLPEANVLIASLEASKQRYLTSLENADFIARTIQRKIDKDVACYNDAIDELQNKIHLLQKPEDSYVEKIQYLHQKIKDHSRQYNQLNTAFRQALTKYDPDIKLIDEIKFDYSPLPHNICSQYKGMSELLTTAPNNCVYINRDQLLFPFPTELKDDASKVIDHYAPQIWHSITTLYGYFDISENKQYFPENLNNQLVIARNVLREKSYLSEHDSVALIERYQEQLIVLINKRNQTIDEGYLDHHFRIDTSSDAFINQFCPAVPPTQPFANAYGSTDVKKRFTRAYAKKILMEYPAELHFTVSEEGLFSIPKQKETNTLIIDFTNSNQFIAYDMAKQTDLPYIIQAKSPNTAIITHSLIAELDLKLQHFWKN